MSTFEPEYKRSLKEIFESPLTATTMMEIDSFSHEVMCYQWRFARPGTFKNGAAYDYWKARFDDFGGMTPAISKFIGWEPLKAFGGEIRL